MRPGHTPAHPIIPGKPPGRRERKKRDTRRRIFRAAFELFTEKGFDHATVEEIAERADVGKGTFFNYFPQKSSLLLAAYQEWLSVLQEELGPVEVWKGTPRAQIARVFGHLTEMAVLHRGPARQVIFESMRQAHLRLTREEAEGEGAPSLGGEDPEGIRLLEGMVREVVLRGLDDARIRPGVDPEEAASLIAAVAFQTLVRGLVREWPSEQIRASWEAKLDIVFQGLAP